MIDRIVKTIGIDNVKTIHINDSKFECGSKRDRHEAIGKGYIGLEGFKSIINRKEFENIPAILEVPGGEEVFRDNIALLKTMRK